MKKKQLIITILLLLFTSLLKCYHEDFLFLKTKYVLWLIVLGVFGTHSFLSFKGKEFKLTIYDLLVLALVLLGLVNFLWLSPLSIYHVRIWYYIGYLMFYTLVRVLVNSKKQTNLLLQLILTSAIVMALVNVCIGGLQYYEIISSPNEFFKITGMFHSPNQLGVLLSLGLFSCFVFIKKLKQKKLFQIVLYLGSMLLLGSLYLTKSRGAFLALFISLIYFSLNKKVLKSIPKNYYRLGTTILFLGLSAWGTLKLYLTNTDSIYGRYFILKTTFKQIIKQPWGYGIGSFAQEYNKTKAVYFESAKPWQEIKNADFVSAAFNDFLELTFEMGVLWIGIFGYLLFLIFRKKSTTVTIKTTKSLIVLLGVFACTNSIVRFPFFIIIYVLCLLIILNERNNKIIMNIKRNSFSKIVLISPLLFLLILIPLRLRSEVKLSDLKEKETLKDVDMSQYLKYIDHNGKEHFFVATLYKNKKQQEKSFEYLDISFQKNAMPRIGRHLGLLHAKNSNISKALEVFNYNKHVEPYRYKARMDLLNLYIKNNDIKNILKTAKEIIELPVKIPSKKVNNYKNTARKFIRRYQRVKLDSTISGNLSLTKSLKSKALNKRIPYKVYLPPLTKIHKKLPVLYINDGFVYINKGKMVKKIDSLINIGKIKPIMAVFIKPADLNNKKENKRKIRNELYFCNDKYNDFLTQELFTTIEKRYPASKKRSMVGVSFGGLSAAYTAIKNPTSFENLILQSPAFHVRKEIYKRYNNLPTKDFNVFLSYGTGRDTEKQDVPFIKILEKKDYKLHVEKVIDGNHTWDVWEKQLNDILIRYCGI